MKKLLRRLRGFGPWIWLVSSIGAPIYRLVWEYVINLRGKMLYLLSEYRGVRDPELDRRGFKIVCDPDFVAIAKLLRQGITPDIIDRERRRLLSTENEYSSDFFTSLDDGTRAAILRLAIHPSVVKYVLSYLRVVPRIRIAGVLLNIVRSELGEEGSKLWHRDSHSYKCLTLFIYLSEVNDNSGPFSVIGKDQVPFHAEVPKAYIDLSQSLWKRYRLTDEEIFPYVDRSKVRKLVGEIGTAILWDSGACYHKGGHCQEKQRLVLQIRYVTDDGDANLPGWASIVNFRHHEVAGLLSDPVCQYMVGRGDTSLIRRLRLFRVLKMIYFRIMRYHARPKMRQPSAG